MAYDQATGDIVLFGCVGDFASGGFADDTWLFNGTTWIEVASPTSPPARQLASMAYDSTTQSIVLFGGEDPPSGHSASPKIFEWIADTWSFDGSAWTQLSPSSSPPGRWGASMVYDPAVDQLVLVGGFLGSGANVADTWPWDGQTWTQNSTATTMTSRDGASMDYDGSTGTIVLFGGESPNGSSQYADTWAFAAGSGYWLVGSDGGMFAFGSAPYEGSVPQLGLNVHDIVGIAHI